MEEQIVLALKTKYQHLGFGQKAFDGVTNYLKTLIKEEAEIETIIDGVGDMLKSFQGETDKIRTEKVELEKRIAALELTPTSVPSPPLTPTTEPLKPASQEEVPSWATELTNRLKAMEEKGLSQQFAETLKQHCPKVGKSFYNIATNGRSFTSREDVISFGDNLNKQWDNHLQETANENLGKNSIPGQGNVNLKNKATDNELNEVANAMGM